MCLCAFQVSTHGYSQNQILVWKYPSLTQVAKLTGHSYRVLYLVSVDGAYVHFFHAVSPVHEVAPDGEHSTVALSVSYLTFLLQAMSPDGEAIVTGAGDETLRFWNVFSKMRSTKVTFRACLQCLPHQRQQTVSPPSLSLGIRVGAEPLHPDPVVSPSSAGLGGMNPGRNLVFACVLTLTLNGPVFLFSPRRSSESRLLLVPFLVVLLWTHA